VPPNTPLQQTNAPRIAVHSELVQVRSQLNARTLASYHHPLVSNVSLPGVRLFELSRASRIV
jgi:hypothetical protein